MNILFSLEKVAWLIRPILVCFNKLLNLHEFVIKKLNVEKGESNNDQADFMIYYNLIQNNL